MPASKHTGWLSPLIYLSNNVISFTGVLLTTGGAISWLFLLPVYFGEGFQNPYLGILSFLILPGLFFGGLLMIPLGMMLRRGIKRRKGHYPAEFPPINWKNREFRRLVVFAVVATCVNFVIGGHLSYSAVRHMDSVEFCGQACHVMQPEFTAFEHSPHARIQCVDCHVGPGAAGFLESKWSGASRFVEIVLGTYPAPVIIQARKVLPASETCENCHAWEKPVGHRLRVLEKFAEDEENSSSKTVLLLRVGGGDSAEGIHGAHLGNGIRVEYLADQGREKISWVRHTNATRGAVEFVDPDGIPDELAGSEPRVMDCTDCHNRPAHAFESADRALNNALAKKRIDPSLPMVKKTALELLERSYESHAEAERELASGLDDFYQSQYPEVHAARGQAIRQAGRELAAIYKRNVFPEMKVGWGTYPNQIGHTEFPGCFRCHDGLHATAGGETITQDCGVCHELLAIEEPAPEILSSLGIAQ